MKIGIDAHILEDYRTGAARYLFNLLQEWSKLSQKFVLYFRNRTPNDIPDSDNFQKRIIKTNSNALFIHYFLPRAAEKDKVDILFCPAYVAPIFYKGKIALALHDIIYEARPDLYNWPSVFDRILLKKVSKISAKKAKIIFACSQFTKNEIIKHYKINPDKIFVTPLATDKKFTPHFLKKSRGLKNIKRKYGIKDKFIFYVGAIINRRFIPETIKGFIKTTDKLPDYQFLIGGRNYTNQEIKGKGVIHIDYIDENDLNILYNAADLFIWLSSYEGFGLPPLEAMACATPVITTKMSSLPEVVDEAGLFVENPENINEISQAIYKGLIDKELRKELINRGLEQAKKFSWQRTAKQTINNLLENE